VAHFGLLGKNYEDPGVSLQHQNGQGRKFGNLFMCTSGQCRKATVVSRRYILSNRGGTITGRRGALVLKK